MKAVSLLVLVLGAFAPSIAQAMCGCMVPIRPKRPRPNQIVAKKILNEASKVILVRNGEQTIMTMSNDVITDYDAFGLVVPVPTVIKKKDVRVVGDENGLVTDVNLIVGTTHNNAPINMSVKQAAQTLIKDGVYDQGILNQVEMAIRAYDPCLSCATHDLSNRIPVRIEIRGPDGEVVDTLAG